MKYIHVKKLDKYHPGYKDRKLKWAKIYFDLMHGDSDFEVLDEIDRGRFISFIMLELQNQKPIPYDENYLSKKGFRFDLRQLPETLANLTKQVEISDQNGVQVLETEDVTETVQNRNKTVKNRALEKNKKREEKSKSTVTENVTEPDHPLVKYIKENLPNVCKLKLPSNNEAKSLLDDYGWHTVQEILLKMENYKPLAQKNVNAVLTARNWLRRDNAKKIDRRIHEKTKTEEKKEPVWNPAIDPDWQSKIQRLANSKKFN